MLDQRWPGHLSPAATASKDSAAAEVFERRTMSGEPAAQDKQPLKPGTLWNL